MSFKDILTPENTEEIRPGLFVQMKPNSDGGIDYKQIHPIAWNGEWKLKNQFGLKNIFVIALVLFIAWSYNHDIEAYQDFYLEVHSNPVLFCNNIYNSNILMEETEFEISKEMINGYTYNLPPIS
jgi:hypothetical protein